MATPQYNIIHCLYFNFETTKGLALLRYFPTLELVILPLEILKNDSIVPGEQRNPLHLPKRAYKFRDFYGFKKQALVLPI